MIINKPIVSFEGNKIETSIFKALMWLSGCVVNDKLYVSGGYDERETANGMLCLESGDEGKRWVLKAPLLEKRSYHVMETLDNQIYVLGGYILEHNSAELVDVKVRSCDWV